MRANMARCSGRLGEERARRCSFRDGGRRGMEADVPDKAGDASSGGSPKSAPGCASRWAEGFGGSPGNGTVEGALHKESRRRSMVVNCSGRQVATIADAGIVFGRA